MTLLDEGAFAETTTDADASTAVHSGQWRLARVELVNWGTFDGFTGIDVARDGHLFTGPSGSGKSSLLDAIATALTPGSLLRLNAAAQDTSTRADDRTLMSYVRGAWSREADADEDRAVAAYLRENTTWSGILLRFEDARTEPVTLMRLFHVRGASRDRAALSQLAFIDRGVLSLADVEPFVRDGLETRRMKSAWPRATVTTSSHGTYFAKLTRLLDIGGEGALGLLHRTQSAKNLGSLDKLFRTFMLDDPRTFALRDNAVDQFRELRAAHQVVVDAREQVAALDALDEFALAYDAGIAAADEAQRLETVLGTYVTRLALRLVEADLAGARAVAARAESAAEDADRAVRRATELYATATREADAFGGSDLRDRLDREEHARDQTRKLQNELSADLTGSGLAMPRDGVEFRALQDQARAELAQREQHRVPTQTEADRAYADHRNALDRVDRELAALRAHASNVDAELQRVRREIAGALGVAPGRLPFAAELIDVLPDFAAWTGAIERVLRPLARTLLVPDDLIEPVRRFVDAEHLRTRLVYEHVTSVQGRLRSASSARSLLHRIAVVRGPFHDWMQHRLVDGYDIECVESADELASVDRGVTIRGQVRSSRTRYEKDDRSRIDDRDWWVLGSRNDDKIEMFLARRRELVASVETAEREIQAERAQRDREAQRVRTLERVLALDWAPYDLDAAELRVRELVDRLEELTAGNTAFEAASERQRQAREDQRAATDAFGIAKAAAGSARDRATALGVRRDTLAAEAEGTSIEPADEAALEMRFSRATRRLDADSVGQIATDVQKALSNERVAAREQSADARRLFEAGASSAKQRFEAALSELSATIEDRAGYRQLADTVRARGLPEFEERFRTMLRERSQEAIAQLLSELRDAPRLVRDRVEPVNESLSRSPFDRDRFLQIRVKEQRSPEVLAFMDTLREISSGSLGETTMADAERRFALLAEVMEQLSSSESAAQSWQRRCLDTREHVTFIARELDPDGVETNRYDSSAGLSGGQRQKLVIFCLAAALRYQLTPDEEQVPRFGTVVLDEAFDKADSAYTRLALDVFRSFGFQMILATPQKLLSTIEEYVGAATAISNPTRQQSLAASVDWSDRRTGSSS